MGITIHTKKLKSNWKAIALMETLLSSASSISNRILIQTPIKDIKKERRFRSLYLISEQYKIIIKLFCNHKIKDVNFVSTHPGYKVFNYKIGISNIDKLLRDINDYRNSFKNFIDSKSIELEEELPKSEQWFRFKFEAEEIYKNFEFKYNVPFKMFIYDNLCRKYRVVIEIDGSIHDLPEQIEKDKNKDRFTKSYGYDMIRIKAFDEESFILAMSRLKNILKRKRPQFYKEPLPKVILRKAI